MVTILAEITFNEGIRALDELIDVRTDSKDKVVKIKKLTLIRLKDIDSAALKYHKESEQVGSQKEHVLENVCTSDALDYLQRFYCLFHYQSRKLLIF